VFGRSLVEHFFFVAEGEHRAAGMRQHAVDRAIVGEVAECRAMRGSALDSEGPRHPESEVRKHPEARRPAKFVHE
jgi:hypothetical protein